ncbi:mechanosensitive ion channel family protein [Oceaniserpentilla sp. 4NH20-0058]|uniref:mechanosensitive ion channel family protein n=1 Tax=Oceaniserpentilla sp. 4NH20-0058 TaxID=3127660 RepID=UPI003108878C
MPELSDLVQLLEFWWVKSIVTLVIGLIAYFISLFVINQLKIKASYTRNLFDDAVIGALEAPINYGVMLCTIGYILHIAQVEFAIQILPKPYHIYVVSISVLFAWFVLRLIRIREHQILKGKVETKADQTTISAIFKLLRISVVVVTCLVVFQTLGVSVSGIIAFGGVGGAAVAFAAKDMLANFFGGLMVYLDKPFAVGDWVRSPDQNIEGTVENIGWRVTRIRTFDKRPLYVPNSVFTQISIENPSRMSHRRIYETIGVRYADFSQVEAICNDVKALLKQHVDIDDSQTMMVNFNRFADSSLEFFIYCFTHTTHWQTYHAIKQDVLLKIGEIILSHGAEIAFPSQSIYVENTNPVTQAQSEVENIQK